MSNIFENAHFGDRFITNGGTYLDFAYIDENGATLIERRLDQYFVWVYDLDGTKPNSSEDCFIKGKCPQKEIIHELKSLNDRCDMTLEDHQLVERAVNVLTEVFHRNFSEYGRGYSDGFEDGQKRALENFEKNES